MKILYLIMAAISINVADKLFRIGKKKENREFSQTNKASIYKELIRGVFLLLWAIISLVVAIALLYEGILLIF